MKDKFKKILLACTCLFTMLFSNITGVFAVQKEPPYLIKTIDDVHETEEYPYIVFFTVPNSQRVDAFISSTPITYDVTIFDNNEGSSFSIRFNGFEFCRTSDKIYQGIYGTVTTYSGSPPPFDILKSNHDIYDTKGNLVFQNPQIPNPDLPPVHPDTDWMKNLGSVFLMILMAVTGGMILLTVLFHFLKRLPNFFRRFGIH